MTASRRLAPLPLLLIALLALGGVLLWSTLAEAQTTSRILVSNVGQGGDDNASLSGNDHAQLFHTAANTGSNTGYVLTSVIVVSEDTQGDDFDVEICLADDTTAFPTSTCTELTPPGSFVAGTLEFTAPGAGMRLNANDNYVVVFKQIGIGSVTLDSTTDNGEDSTGLSGWSIKNKFDWKSGGAWQHKGGTDEAIQITVKGSETPANQDATGRPVILSPVDEAGVLYAHTLDIRDADGIPISGDSSTTTYLDKYHYKWIRVDGDDETHIGTDSRRYRLVDADTGKLIKVEVSFDDHAGNAERVTSKLFGPIVEPAPLPATTLVSNTGQPAKATVTDITGKYSMGFTLGDHGQGYEISGVSVDLAAAPTDLTVSLWMGKHTGSGQGGSLVKLFDFENPATFRTHLNEFAAPAGAFAYQAVEYFVVLSDFGASLSINETASNSEDAGGETGATLFNSAGGDTNVLRMAVKGSRRDGGVLVSNFAQPGEGDQEIISIGDLCCFTMDVGNADRYLIRGFSWTSDDTTTRNGGWRNPFELHEGTDLELKDGDVKDGDETRRLTMYNTRNNEGVAARTAPLGATVAGGSKTYTFFLDVNLGVDGTGTKIERLDAVLIRNKVPIADGEDEPGAAGFDLSGGFDATYPDAPYVTVFGEPLYAMTSNLGKSDNGYVSLGGANAKVVSQGFRTGPDADGYTLLGIGVDITQVPSRATAVSVSVHAESGGKPGAKLFDLVNPGEFAPGHNFFEAPRGTTLDANTNYVMVWRYNAGTWHRLHRTTSDADGIPISGDSSTTTILDKYHYKWIRVDGDAETHIGTDSSRYRLVDADTGKLIKVEVSFDDHAGNAERVTSLPFGPIVKPAPLPATTLVSNTGQPAKATDITGKYSMGFTLGDHGQGYEISGVSIDLAAAPTDLTVSLWMGKHTGSGQGGSLVKLFDFENPATFRTHLNEFAAPAGAFAYQAVEYFVVLSDFGASLSINETASNSEDAGGETGATLFNSAGGDTNVLRMAVKGSRRDGGILVSNFAQPGEGDQEIISVGDLCCFTMDVGNADRYLIRGFSWTSDDTTTRNGGWRNPFELHEGTDIELKDGDVKDGDETRRLTMYNTRNNEGVAARTAPLGATVAGGSKTYTFFLDVNLGVDGTGTKIERLDAVLIRNKVPIADGEDEPGAAGFDLSGGFDATYPDAPYVTVFGEPLDAMVQNLGQTDNSYASATATNAVLSQGITTGSHAAGYELLGIGVNIEGSSSKYPDGPTFVSVAVHADSNGKPGAKLFDLVSPTEFAAGHSFFEAPSGKTLDASTSYVMVWRHLGGAEHRLHRTLGDGEDSGKLTGFSIANVFYRGADLDNLSANSTSNALEIAVYGVESDQPLAMPTASFERATYSVTESGSVTVKVQLSEDPKRTVTIPLTATNQGGATGADYSGVPASVTFQSGDTEKSFTFTAADDTDDDDDESVKLGFGTLPTGVTAGTTSETTVSIRDNDDPAVTVSFELADYSVAEGDTVAVKVKLSAAPERTVAIPLTTTNQSGATSADYSGVPAGVTFQSGDTENSFTFTAAQDIVNDDGESVKLGFGTLPAGVTAGTRNEATVSITNRVVPSVNSIAMTSNPIDYGNTQNTYSNGEPIRATVTFSEAVDITGRPRLTMRIGSTDKHASCAAATITTTMVCTYTVIQDDRDTDGLSINANSLSLNGGTIRKAGSSTINALLDHSGLGRLSSHKVDGGLRTNARSLSAVTAYATETGNGTNTTMTFSVFLSRKASKTVTVDYSTADGSAEAGKDYRATSGTLSFPPQTQVRTVYVTIYDDGIAEWTEYLVLVLSNPQGPAAILTKTPNGEGRIYDETPAFHTYDESAYESSSSTMRFYVSLNPEPDQETTVNYATRDVTARAGSDYTSTSGTLTFPVGVGRQTIDVDILDDNVDDSGETFQVVLSSPTGGARLRVNRSIATGTILNTDPEEALSASFPTSVYSSKSHSGADDRPQVVAAFSEAVASFTKDTSSVSVTNASVASVQAHSEDGLENGYIFFLTPNGDGDVTFTFEADSACASGGVCTSAGIPLTDVPTALIIPGPEETTQTSQLSVSDATASEEDDSTIDFVVTLSPAGDESVTVDYATANGTAAAGDDYTAKSGSLTFNAGETSKTIQVAIIDDTVDDDNETLTVTLSNASGAEISDGQATGTITDGDTETSPLTAGFQDLPDSHDGSTAFTFRVLFSEDVGISYVNMRDDAFSLSEGDLTGARRVDGRNDLWEITVEPDDDSDVGITLPANRSCTTIGAICTREDSPRQLTNSPTATVTGPAEAPPTNTSAAGAPTISGTPQVEQTLTADTSSITDEDGLTNVSYSYQWIAGGSDIAGATGSTYTLTSSEQGQTVQVRVTFTDDADNEETLTSIATAAVAAAPEPLTVRLKVAAPATHDGSSEFTFEIEFSEEFGLSYRTLKSHAFNVTGGSVEMAQRTDKPSNIAWLITVKPQGNGDVTIVLPVTTDCGVTGAICTGDGRKLSNSLSFTVSGPGG